MLRSHAPADAWYGLQEDWDSPGRGLHPVVWGIYELKIFYAWPRKETLYFFVTWKYKPWLSMMGVHV